MLSEASTALRANAQTSAAPRTARAAVKDLIASPCLGRRGTLRVK